MFADDTADVPQGRIAGRLVRLASSSAGRSAAARVLVLGVQAVLTFVTTRLLFETSGAEAFAAMALVSSLFAMLPFTDLGTGAAVSNAVATAQDHADDELVRRTILTAFRVLCVVGTVICLVGALFLVDSVREIVLGHELSALPAVGEGAMLAVLAFGVSLPLGLSQRILLGLERNHLAVAAQVVGPVATLAVVAGVMALSGSAGLNVAAPGIAMLGTGVATTWLTVAHAPRWMLADLRKVFDVRSHQGVAILGTAGPMMVISVGLALALQSDRLVLAHVSGNTPVAAYSLAAQLYLPFWAVVSSAGLTLWPRFASARARGESAVDIHRGGLLGLGVAGLVGSACLLALGPTVTQFLSAGAVSVGGSVFVAFGCLLVVQSLHYVNGMLLTDARGLKLQAITVVAMLVLNLPLSIALARRLGAVGPIWASAGAVLFCQLIPCWIAARRRLAVPVQSEPEPVKRLPT